MNCLLKSIHLPSDSAIKLAGGRGFEPRLTESESVVLPLDDPPFGTRNYKNGTSQVNSQACRARMLRNVKALSQEICRSGNDRLANLGGLFLAAQAGDQTQGEGHSRARTTAGDEEIILHHGIIHIH